MNLKIKYYEQENNAVNEISDTDISLKQMNFKNGINFLKTSSDSKKLAEFMSLFSENECWNEEIFIDEKKIQTDEWLKLSCSINNCLESAAIRKKKLKSLIKDRDKITDIFEISDKMLDTRVESLWHSAYLCLVSAGISSGKKIFVYPWIPCRECSVQSYRLNLICRYASSNDIIVIVPTDSITYNGADIGCTYNMLSF